MKKTSIKILNRLIRKNEENKTANEWTWNIFEASFSFPVLASRNLFVISFFTSTDNLPKHSGVILE